MFKVRFFTQSAISEEVWEHAGGELEHLQEEPWPTTVHRRRLAALRHRRSLTPNGT